MLQLNNWLKGVSIAKNIKHVFAVCCCAIMFKTSILCSLSSLAKKKKTPCCQNRQISRRIASAARHELFLSHLFITWLNSRWRNPPPSFYSFYSWTRWRIFFKSCHTPFSLLCISCFMANKYNSAGVPFLNINSQKQLVDRLVNIIV